LCNTYYTKNQGLITYYTKNQGLITYYTKNQGLITYYTKNQGLIQVLQKGKQFTIVVTYVKKSGDKSYSVINYEQHQSGKKEKIVTRTNRTYPW
jgi:HKD family nuclease